MTTKEAFSLESCPECGYRLLKNPTTGLVSCLACLEFMPCKWNIRVKPFTPESSRERLSRNEKIFKEQQEKIDKMKEMYGGD